MADPRRELLERLDRALNSSGDAGAGGAPATAALVVRSPYRFARGAAVLDLATGVRGIVIAAPRINAAGVAAYDVRLEDDRVVTRSERELEPDPMPPATRPR
jgi:hypothetical protein